MDREEKEDRVSVVGVPQKNRVRKMQQEEIASHEGFLDYTVSSSLERYESHVMSSTLSCLRV